MPRMKVQLAWMRSHPGFRAHPVRSTFRLGLWRALTLAGRESTVSLPELGITMSLPSHWRGSSKLIYTFRDQCDEDLRSMLALIRPGMTIVDAGAHLGLHACAFGRAVGDDGRVIAVEASGAMHSRLQRNIAVNGLSNVSAFHLALASEPGTVRLHHHADPSRASLGEPASTGGHEDVPADTVDALLVRTGITRLDFLKLDIEGAEALALRGASRTLSTLRPMVAFEVHPAAEARLDVIGDSWAILKSHGYSLLRLPSFESVDAYPERFGDYLAVLPGRHALPV